MCMKWCAEVLQSLKCTFETLDGKGRMDIWVQPLDAEGSTESQKAGPMKQIQVTATNYLDELRTRGPKAVEAPKDSDCNAIHSSFSIWRG